MMRLQRLDKRSSMPNFSRSGHRFDMRALNLMVDRLTDVVEERTRACDCGSAPSSVASMPAICAISTECGAILAVAGTEVELTEERDRVGAEPYHTCFVRGGFAFCFPSPREPRHAFSPQSPQSWRAGYGRRR